MTKNNLPVITASDIKAIIGKMSRNQLLELYDSPCELAKIATDLNALVNDRKYEEFLAEYTAYADIKRELEAEVAKIRATPIVCRPTTAINTLIVPPQTRYIWRNGGVWVSNIEQTYINAAMLTMNAEAYRVVYDDGATGYLVERTSIQTPRDWTAEDVIKCVGSDVAIVVNNQWEILTLINGYSDEIADAFNQQHVTHFHVLPLMDV